MTQIEEKGRTLLLEVIVILFIIATISFFIEPDVVSLFFLLINAFLWGLMYKGYALAKFLTIIWLLISAITITVLMITYQATPGLTFWWIIQLIIFIGASVILIFSKSISEYMLYKRD